MRKPFARGEFGWIEKSSPFPVEPTGASNEEGCTKARWQWQGIFTFHFYSCGMHFSSAANILLALLFPSQFTSGTALFARKYRFLIFFEHERHNAFREFPFAKNARRQPSFTPMQNWYGDTLFQRGASFAHIEK
jgi:hypothetical protein